MPPTVQDMEHLSYSHIRKAWKPIDPQSVGSAIDPHLENADDNDVTIWTTADYQGTGLISNGICMQESLS